MALEISGSVFDFEFVSYVRISGFTCYKKDGMFDVKVTLDYFTDKNKKYLYKQHEYRFIELIEDDLNLPNFYQLLKEQDEFAQAINC